MSELEREMEPVAMGTVGVKPDKKSGIGKKIGIFFLILIGLLVLFFIATLMIKSYNRSRYKDEFYLQQEVKEYLEERYNEEFIVMFNRGMSGAYNYMQLYAYPMAYQDEMHKIEIQGYYNDWGKMDFYDDYVMIKLIEEYEAYVEEIINDYYKDYKFFMEFHSEWITSNLPSDIQLEDLWNLKANEDYPLPAIFIYLSPNEENKESNENELNYFLNSLQENHYRGRVDVWYMTEKDRYELAERNNWGDIMKYTDYDDMVTYFIYSNEIKSMEE